MNPVFHFSRAVTRVLLLIGLLWLFGQTPARAQGAIPDTERDALIALYNSTNGPNWLDNTNWLDDTPCGWQGVTCSSDHVTSLYLLDNRLSGTIPPELSNLANLEELNLEFNQLTGSVPPELGNLANLHYLYLGGNRLTGSIPPELGNLANLISLDIGTGQPIGSNQLTGSIPPELGNLANLHYLYLGSNRLTGSIPPELGNLSSLWTLDLVYNQLTGSIPPELGNLNNLVNLRLWGNQLTGGIPPELGNLAGLYSLYLGYNQLTGGIPPELGNLNNLENFSLNNNRLAGSIPPELGNLSNLWGLWIDNNQLSGEVPTSFTGLVSLAYLDIGYNGLSAADAAVTTFLNSKNPDWATTQTIAPENLHIVSTTHKSITLSWTPIPYVADGGYYEISYAPVSGGAFAIAGTTANKSASSFVVTGLLPGTAYNFRVRTYTPAHGDQQNTLWSDYSDVITGLNAAPPRNYFTTDTPTLTWNRVTGAETYEIQVATTATFTLPLVFTDTVPADTLTVTTPSLTNGTYYWRVRALNSSAAGAWSVTDSFTVHVP